MNQKILSKKKKRDNKENQIKEEEDMRTNVEAAVNIEMSPMNYYDNLDMVVAGIKIENKEIESFEQYQKKINKILSQYRDHNKESDYRLKIKNESVNMMKVDVEENLSKIEKMKTIGKIGDEVTKLDKESSSEDLQLKNERCKVASLGSFASIRANNCVFKGKWCYEVVLLSNKQNQIGWCQITTPFRGKLGVGNDSTSFAYDGYKMKKLNLPRPEKYGMFWDIGDVIGVCIDIENKKIEYFQNGISLGVAYKDIPTGPNVAYFPAISLNRNEKVIFNFGNQEMIFKYEGYEPMDIPKSIYNKSYEITESLLQILKSHILYLINIKDIDNMSKISISSRIFSFLVNVSFRDFYIFTNLIIPFLLTIGDPSVTEDYFNFTLENLLLYADNKSEFINHIFENISSLIEFYSSRQFEGINRRENLLSLFIRLLKIDQVCQLWLDSRKCVDHLTMVFSGNYVNTNHICQEIVKSAEYFTRHTIDKGFRTFEKFYFEFRSDYMNHLEKSGMINYEKQMNKIMIGFINFFIHDNRNFTMGNRFKKLKVLLLENYVKNVKESSIHGNDIVMFLGGGGHSINPNEPFIKYFYFNLLEIFINENLNLDINEFSVEPWMNRNKSESIYYDEVGIGGTIAHVNTEYGNKIDKKYKEKNENMTNYLLHRILLTTNNYIIPVLKSLQKSYEQIKTHKMNDFEAGNTNIGPKVHSMFRSYFSILTRRNQEMLYQLSYFIVYWINQLIKINKELTYFIPKSIMQIPYDIFKFLLLIKSPILKDNEQRKMANEKSPYFLKDDYLYQILIFYSNLFSDTAIMNPELKEGFMNKISFFLKSEKIMKKFEETEDLMEPLLKGLLNYMTCDHMCHLASQNLVKIIKPSCFGEKKKINPLSDNIVNVVQKFFEKNPVIFKEFMDNYYKLLNKIMTDYTVSLTNAYNKITRPNREQVPGSSHDIKSMIFEYEILCDLIKILEFLLYAYPDEIFDISTINYTRFSNFLKNLSSRILDKNYIEKLLEVVKKVPDYLNYKYEGFVTNLLYSVIGIFNNLNENKKKPNFSDFVNKLVLQSDFDVDPFNNIFDYIKKDETNPFVLNGFKIYKEILEFFKSLKSKKVLKKMTEEEWEETTKKENICIICYVNENDKMMMPCKHGCCNECLQQYLSDKSHCFICNAQIETTVNMPSTK